MKQLSFIFFLCLAVVACKEQTWESQIIGQWQVVKCAPHFPDLSPNIIEGGRQEALSSSYAFFADGTSKTTSNFYADGRNGSWQIDLETENIVITYPEGEDRGPETYKIELFDNNQMVWLQDLAPMGSVRLILEKNDNR